MKLAILLLSIIWSAAAYSVCFNSVAPSTPTEQFVFYQNGTVLDTATGLLWKRCREGATLNNNGTLSNFTDDTCSSGAAKEGWQVALQRVENVNSTGGFAGYTDWRLPNIKELNSIVEVACHNPSLNQEVFPDPFIETTSFRFYASSPAAISGTSVWSIHFGAGSVLSTGKVGTSFSLGYTRLVRGGQ